MSLKMLVAGDFHAREELLEACREELEENNYDLYINAGDYMDLDYAERLFEGLDVAAIGTTGNRDLHMTEEDLEGLPVFHFLEADIDDEYKLIMIGGDFPDDVQEKVAEMIEDTDPEKLIICSHYPPKKLGDKITSGKRIGFDQFRRMIMKHKPALWVNGHVHEDFGENELMGTKVLNASSFDSGKAFSVTLDDGEVEVEEVELLSSK
ncbi:MAG: metallophosphoesterase family protein [Candidatus Nanohaloarchaea archaeon]